MPLSISVIPGRAQARTRNLEIPGSALPGCPAMTEKLIALHECREGLGIVLVPARQRWTVLDDVARGPKDAALVELAGHVIVRTEDVEISGADALDHEVDGLLGRPGAGRLLGAAVRCQPREDEARNEQMRSDLAAGRVAQFVLQRFAERLHAGLGDIISGIAGRRGDALFGAGVDDEAGPSVLDHARRKHLRAIDDAPEIDAENSLPALMRAEHLAARLDAGIVQEDVGAAEARAHRAFQFRHFIAMADIDRHG